MSTKRKAATMDEDADTPDSGGEGEVQQQAATATTQKRARKEKQDDQPKRPRGRPPKAKEPTYRRSNTRMSESVVWNGVVRLAGQVSGKQGIKEQTSDVLEQIDSLLAEAGSSKAKLLRAQIFLVNPADFAGMNEVWEKWLGDGPKPARATVIAQLVRPEWLVEIVIDAAV